MFELQCLWSRKWPSDWKRSEGVVMSFLRSLSMKKTILLRLLFQVIKPIHSIPHYQGIYWSTLFREVYKAFQKPGEEFHQIEIAITPADSAILDYNAGDVLEVGITCSQKEEARLSQVLMLMQQEKKHRGHFSPNLTIKLLTMTCRVSDQAWPKFAALPVEDKLLEHAIEQLCEIKQFKICLTSPLRLARAEGTKVKSHKYWDENYFQEFEQASDHFFHKLTEKKELGESKIQIQEVYGYWLDVSYGSHPFRKTVGGLMGSLHCEGLMDPEMAKEIILQQWWGFGKNKGFGFGQYEIPELEMPLLPLVKHTSVFAKAIHPKPLLEVLHALPDSAPGPDGVTPAEAQKMASPLCKTLVEKIKTGDYQPDAPLLCTVPKKNGSTRNIYLSNVQDRVLQKSVLAQLSPALDRLLSESSYAYRAGVGRHHAKSAYQRYVALGYRYAVRTDIEAFFDSIQLDRVAGLLNSLFARDLAITHLLKWLGTEGQRGLPQGNALSPALSNLFLETLDRALLQKDLKLIRYGDDLLLLFRQASSAGDVLKTLKNLLNTLGLSLVPEKTEMIEPGRPFVYLGFHLLDGQEIAKETPADLSEGLTVEPSWRPLFGQDWQIGQFVYITSQIKHTGSRNNRLLLEGYDGQKKSVPWSEIQAIHVIGKQRVSGGVIARALQEKVPISFQYLCGSSYGFLSAENSRVQFNIVSRQLKAFADPEIALNWAKATITAKVNNQRVLLKRVVKKIPDSLTFAPRKIQSCTSLESLRAIEGNAAKLYFQGIRKVIPKPFVFESRKYHPVDGPINALLSFGYTLIYHRLTSALTLQGLDTRSGFFHQGRGNHAVLTSDLMEEIRYLVDRIVLAVVRLGIIREEHFTCSHHGGSLDRLNATGIRLFIHRFEETMASAVPSEWGPNPQSHNHYLNEIAINVCTALKLGLTYQPKKIR